MKKVAMFFLIFLALVGLILIYAYGWEGGNSKSVDKGGSPIATTEQGKVSP